MTKELTEEQEQRAVEVLAEMDGWTDVHKKTLGVGTLYFGTKDGLTERLVPFVLTSKDAQTPIIEGLTEEELGQYRRELQRLLFFDEDTAVTVGMLCREVLRATASHLAEALIRMEGKWGYVIGEGGTFEPVEGHSIVDVMQKGEE